MEGQPPEDRIVRTLDGSKTLLDEHCGQLLRSKNGAVQESYHVFLRATGVLDRLKRGEPTRVLEIGFGTGLNALLTLSEARSAEAELTFVSVERKLLSAELLRRLEHREQLAHPSVADLLLRAVELGERELRLDERSHFRLLLGDARELDLPRQTFDAVYLDPFSPEVNPDAWTPAFLGRLYDALVPGGRLSTYCAKGDVRRALAALGFEVQRLAGPRGKRHMLLAVRPKPPE